MNDVLLLLEEQGYDFERVIRYFPMLQELRGVEQNPVWHGEGDVFCHTRKVCHAVTSLPEWPELESMEKGMLYLAALFHDIGKKCCSRMEEGVMISPRHAITGAGIFRELCYREQEPLTGMTYQLRETIASLIRFHGLPQHFMEKEPVDYYLIKARENTEYPYLYLLAKADILGRECRDQEELLAMADYFKEYTIELDCFYERIPFAGEFTRHRYFQGGKIWPGEELYDTTEFTVYLMAGLPLSGKDTYIAHAFSELPVISLDQLREEMGIRPDQGSAKVVAKAREQAKVLLRKKQPFVWNATNIIADTRQKLCRMFEAYGARVHIIYLEVPYRELLERNRQRERYISEAVLERMIGKLEIPGPTEAYRVEYCISGEMTG